MTQETGHPELPATQAALAAEHATLYGYGVVGARIDGERAKEVRQAHAAHRSGRDALHRAVRDLGATPVPAAAGYLLPFPVTDSDSALALAAELEDRLAGVYADLVRATGGSTRRQAAGALTAAAVRAARWRGAGVPFPGLPEHRSPAEGRN
ncbi:ferritin-like domain-containing protein [Streptomyces sp. ACA25]|uniref:ferritin-like domain-containing protein n=1 Tax=Streptomyces sp. ACA25 TaxID=3022596 RepID=UPI002307E2FB|nr:ferritin-like domain-containing protein [Streptomyces sp. ACA25]MDB1089705.1 ferritin-like domain-containing protein [Streptomyces sp. ACA25]